MPLAELRHPGMNSIQLAHANPRHTKILSALVNHGWSRLRATVPDTHAEPLTFRHCPVRNRRPDTTGPWPSLTVLSPNPALYRDPRRSPDFSHGHFPEQRSPACLRRDSARTSLPLPVSRAESRTDGKAPSRDPDGSRRRIANYFAVSGSRVHRRSHEGR